MNAAGGRFPVARSVVIYIRSLAFNVLFYVNLTAHMIVALPTLLLPYPCLRVFIRSYARTSLWLLRVVCGTKVEWRGVGKIPKGSCIVACKHQSLWETFSLYALLDDPVYVLKRELMWVPLFGWYMRKAGLIPIDRGAGMAALARMTALARQALTDTTPPQIENLAASVEGDKIHVTFRAVDSFSNIKSADYSVDAGEWQFVEPVGQLSDSKTESYDFRVTLPIANSATAKTAAAGQLEHVVVVRVYDRFDNMNSAKTVIRGK